MVCSDTSLSWYLDLFKELQRRGYGREAEWSEALQPVDNAGDFWLGFAWVVLNSGMKNQIAEGIWQRVRPHVMSGGKAGDVFGHKGKAEAIDHVFQHRERLFSEYLAAPDKVEWLATLPWIGVITKWHLAKDFGHDCAKPDRHLVRIAGPEGVAAMCERLSRESGHRIATVDLVIWRAANLGII